MKILIIILLFASFGAQAQPFKLYAKDYRHYGYIWADTLKQSYNLAYNATTWNGNLGVPTMDAIRDKIESLSSGGITSINSQTGPAITIQSGTGTSVTNTTNTVTIEVNTSSNALPHTLNKQYSAVGNTGTSESDLYTYTVPGNTMNTDGQSVHFDAAGLFNDATATVALQFYFAGTSFANTTALTISATGKWSASGYIIRTGSTTATAWVTISSQVTTDKSYTFLADLTGLDFTAGNIFKLTGQAGGGGGSTNDITAKTWVVRYQPL